MKVIATIAAFVVATAATAIPAAAQSPMRPGQWETIMQMSAPNMPAQMPAMKNTRCVTQQEIDSPTRALPNSGKTPNDCKVSDYKNSGNTVTWNMACSSTGMTGSGELRFNGDAYEGLVKMMVQQQEMSMKITGKRLGDCTQQ